MNREHKFHDICVTGVETPRDYIGLDKVVKVSLDASKNEDEPDKLDYIYFTKEDIARIAFWLDLVVYEKDSCL